MRKCIVLLLLLSAALCGCGGEETFETVADDMLQSVSSIRREITVSLPGEAASPTVESGDSRLYQCGDYDVCVQTLEGGDLSRTIQYLTGYKKDDLTVMQTQRDGNPCYEFVWASVGETGDLVGRGLILDDGSYHYCVSLLGDAHSAQKHEGYWEEMFASVTLG